MKPFNHKFGLTLENRQLLIEALAAEGVDLATIGRVFDITRQRVEQVVPKDHRSWPTVRGVTKEQEDEICKLILDGESLFEVSAKVGISENSIRRIKTARGITNEAISALRHQRKYEKVKQALLKYTEETGWPITHILLQRYDIARNTCLRSQAASVKSFKAWRLDLFGTDNWSYPNRNKLGEVPEPMPTNNTLFSDDEFPVGRSIHGDQV